MPKGEPELSSELKNFDSRSNGVLATDVWTSRGSATGAEFPSCCWNRRIATMRTCWRSELLALGPLDCFEAGELCRCVQGRINCASETGPGAYLVSRLTVERIRC